MYFELLHRRLVDHLRARVRSGEIAERSLAAMAGVSQPHLHNVLKGLRVLSMDMADQVLTNLRLTVYDLGAEDDWGRARARRPRMRTHTEVPVLEGRLGPGHPFPDMRRTSGTLPFLRVELAGAARLCAVRLCADRAAAGLFQDQDIALLAPLPKDAQRLSRDSYYAVDAGGSSLIRRVQRRGALLFLKPEDEREPPACIFPADGNILEVLRARVIWIGRYLERSPIADRPVEEAGGEH